VLRPGGTLGLIWNTGCQPDDLADALEGVRERRAAGGHRLFRGTRPIGYPTLRPASTQRSTPSQRRPTSVRRQRSGSHGRGSTSGMSGWTSLSHGATTPPSNQRSETVCSKPSLGHRRSGRLVRHELRDRPHHRDSAGVDPESACCATRQLQGRSTGGAARSEALGV